VPVIIPGVAYTGPVVLEPVVLSSVQRDEILQQVHEFIQPVVPSDQPVAVEVSEGRPVDQILERARALTADLIVMGTHGRSGFERLFIGSVAEKVLRKASCPVLTVPPRVTEAVAPPRYRHILCAVDFSDSSLRALRHALALAEEADAHVRVLHVLELQPESDVPEMPILTANLKAYHDQLKQAARQRLAASIPEDVREYCTVEEGVATGKPYVEILREAREGNADLIVMGVRGRSAADVVLFGSTTQHVVRQATCPVLTMRTA
jgi:nucleotide-binding universal stress UspA family protein